MNFKWTVTGMVVFFVSCAALGLLLGAIPDKWSKATAVGVCGGLAVLRLEDGTVWLRVSSTRTYRVEDKDNLECR